MNIVRAIARVLAWIPFLLLARALPAADAVDLHRLWDGRCAECHGHSAEFARSLLTVNEGRLAGRHHRDDLATFLHNHYLAGSHVDEVYAMLLAQVVTPPRFAEECRTCHGSAADFARDSLVFRDGVLHGRASGEPVRAFLAGHRGLEDADAEFFAEMLDRVAREVGMR